MPTREGHNCCWKGTIAIEVENIIDCIYNTSITPRLISHLKLTKLRLDYKDLMRYYYQLGILTNDLGQMKLMDQLAY